MKFTSGIALLFAFCQISWAQLQTVEIGSSHSMYTVVDENSHFLAADPELNTIIFIHRSNTFLYNDVNENGRYRYDISKNGGATWTSNIGVLNPSSNESGPSGRYPNVAIYNPMGNTKPDSAYLAYVGSYVEPAVSWNGIFTGAARLDNNPSTFKEHINPVNNGDITSIGSLTSSMPGIFWATALSTTHNTTDPKGILLFKGLWNDASKDVDWTVHHVFNPPLDRSVYPVGKLSGVDVDFDPTGQYGWIGFVGDITPGAPQGDVLYTPNFYSTKDGGNTWEGPMVLELPNFAGLLFPRASGYIIPQPTNNMDIAVDANGNLHFLLVVGRSDAQIPYGWLYVFHELYDFQFDINAPEGCEWKAMLIDTLTSGDGAIMQASNRAQISKTKDGTKLFFTWADSDVSSYVGVNGSYYHNDKPNFYSRGYNVITEMATPIVNWTAADPNWKDKAYYPTPSHICFDSSGTYTIPAVVASASSITDTTRFYYIQNIRHTDAQFHTQLFTICDSTAPKYQFLTGIVSSSTGQLVDSGKAILYDVSNPLYGFDTVQMVSLDSDGRYQFNDVHPRELIVKVIPDPNAFPGLAPAYLRNVVKWTGSDSVIIQHNQPDTIFCPQKPVIGPGGTNILKGYISLIGSHKRAEPIEDEDIIVSKTPPGLPSAVVQSDGLGYFEIPGLEPGNYEVFIDHPGIPMFQFNTVDFTGSSTTIELSVLVDSSIITFDADTLATGMVSDPLTDFQIFPSPATDRIWVNYISEATAKTTMTVINTMGQTVLNVERNSTVGKNSWMLDLSKLQSGLYLVNVRSDHGSWLGKVSKMDPKR